MCVVVCLDNKLVGRLDLAGVEVLLDDNSLFRVGECQIAGR
jgi:hypothetical protein